MILISYFIMVSDSIFSCLFIYFRASIAFDLALFCGPVLSLYSYFLMSIVPFFSSLCTSSSQKTSIPTSRYASRKYGRMKIVLQLKQLGEQTTASVITIYKNNIRNDRAQKVPKLLLINTR